METISELAIILHNYFPWNKARLDCLVKTIFAILTVQTVNMSSLANAFFGEATSESHYRRLQRFISWLATFEKAAQRLLAPLTLGILQLGKPGSLLYLAVDRTNWKFGKIHINLLVFGVRYHGVNIPLVWTSLGKAGTSNAQERISLTKHLLKLLGKRPFVLTADREFIGDEWFHYLAKKQIPFVIRIKGNIHVTRPGSSHSVPATQLFKRLRNGKKKALEGFHHVLGLPLFIAAGRNEKGELLIVVSNQFRKRALKEYMKRWGIECLFSCLKKRGFCFEETHLTDKRRISAIFFILVIVTAWTMRAGINMRKQLPIRIASHGRKRKSFFRRGLDAIYRQIMCLGSYLEGFTRFIKLIPKKLLLRSVYEKAF
jgi:hypothetical protein